MLGQIPGKEATYIQRAIEDRNEDVRIVGIRLSDLVGHDTVALIQQLTSDPSVRVRAIGAVHLRHHDTPAATNAWACLAAVHDGVDRWYLEALGIGADGKWDACLAAYAAIDSRATREAKDDILWRSRGTKTPTALARIILAAGKNEDVQRYVRAFDFQTGEQKDDALLSVAFADNVANKIALAALERVSDVKLGTNDRIRQRLVELLSTTDKLGATSLRLIKRHRLSELYPVLLVVAQQEQNDARVDAIHALLDLKQDDLIRRALQGEDSARIRATGSVLAQSQHASAIALLLPFLQNNRLDAPARKATARAFGKSDIGARQLLKMIENKKLSDEIGQAIASLLLTHRNDVVRQGAERQFPLLPAKDARPLPKLGDLIGMKGDAVSGRRVYLNQAKCASCHRVQGEGKAIGPDLSEIGTKLARSAMFEAILYPSAAISHNYESYKLILESGQIATGILIDQNEKHIQLRDAEGNLRTFDRSQVEMLQRQNISLMPANLHQSLTTQELVDLVDYLALLKTKPTDTDSK